MFYSPGPCGSVTLSQDSAISNQAHQQVRWYNLSTIRIFLLSLDAFLNVIYVLLGFIWESTCGLSLFTLTYKYTVTHTFFISRRCIVLPGPERDRAYVACKSLDVWCCLSAYSMFKNDAPLPISSKHMKQIWMRDPLAFLFLALFSLELPFPAVEHVHDSCLV